MPVAELELFLENLHVLNQQARRDEEDRAAMRAGRV